MYIVLTVSFDRVADVYDKTRSFPPRIMKRVVKALTEELEGCRTILDAGVGTGRYAILLQNSGFELVGIDVSRKMLQKAKQKGVANLHLADARYLPFNDLYFDATVCNHVLHLIQEWKTVLREITRVTRHIFLSTTYGSPNPISEAYEELLKKYAFERRKRGISEAQLGNFLKPTRFIAAVTNTPVKADKTLTMFEEKACSRHWDVPNHLHSQILKDLSPFCRKNILSRYSGSCLEKRDFEAVP